MLAGGTPELQRLQLDVMLEQHGHVILCTLTQAIDVVSRGRTPERGSSGDIVPRAADFWTKSAAKQEEAVERWRMERALLWP